MRLTKNQKFRKRLLISSRILALLLILSIFFIGFVQIHYVKEINELRNEYGNQAYCYLCGLENGKSCSCQTIPELIANSEEFDKKVFLENIAIQNIEKCVVTQEKDLNFSLE